MRLDPYTRRSRIGVISTYPPTLCGLATFASALVDQFVRAGAKVDVVCLDDGSNGACIGGAVVARHVNGAAHAVRRTASVLQRCDVVVIQHEFGIFGGPDGAEVIALMDAISAPTIVVAHTVPSAPSPNQRAVLVAVCDRADRVVVMTDTARHRLLALYPVDPDRVVTIPHGAAALTEIDLDAGNNRATTHPDLLTWGLLGPGKGIEHVIDALALLVSDGLRPTYTISGVTHPHVLAEHGDEYRHSLMQQAHRLGVAGSVTFDATYRTVAELTRFVATASTVVLPYDSREQVTSGVLVDAVAAGRPIIATAFPHAIELLSTGAGIVVAHGDVPALADAIRTVFTDRAAREAMAAEARRLAPRLFWPDVASRYLEICDELASSSHPVAM